MTACQFVCQALTCWRDWLLDGTPISLLFTALGYRSDGRDGEDKRPTIIIEYVRYPNVKTFRLATVKYVLKSIAIYTVSFHWTLLYTVCSYSMNQTVSHLTQINLIVFETKGYTGIVNILISSTFWGRTAGTIFKSYSRDGAIWACIKFTTAVVALERLW